MCTIDIFYDPGLDLRESRSNPLLHELNQMKELEIIEEQNELDNQSDSGEATSLLQEETEIATLDSRPKQIFKKNGPHNNPHSHKNVLTRTSSYVHLTFIFCFLKFQNVTNCTGYFNRDIKQSNRTPLVILLLYNKNFNFLFLILGSTFHIFSQKYFVMLYKLYYLFNNKKKPLKPNLSLPLAIVYLQKNVV